MKNSKLLKISITISILGIILLFFLAYTYEPKLIPINSISNKQLNQKIKTSGQITQIKNFKDFQILTINNQIDIITNQKFKLNQKITVIGTLILYNNKLEIKPRKIYLTTLKLS